MPRSWVLFALLSATGFSVMAALVRIASQTLPQTEVVFFRNFMALLFLLPLLLRQRISLAPGCFHLHLLRACSGLAAMYLYFHALTRLPLSDALLLNYTSPLFIALFAVLWLKERATRRRMLAAGLGFLGVALLFHPSSHMASAAGLAGLASGALAGLALTTVKRLSGHEPGIRIVVWFAILASLLSAIPLYWSFVWPEPGEWYVLIAMGLFGSLGQMGLTLAYARAPASQVSPLGYASLLFAGLIGFILWNETPDLVGLAGTIVIIAAGIMVSREQAEPAPEPPGSVPAVERKNNGAAP